MSKTNTTPDLAAVWDRWQAELQAESAGERQAGVAAGREWALRATGLQIDRLVKAADGLFVGTLCANYGWSAHVAGIILGGDPAEIDARDTDSFWAKALGDDADRTNDDEEGNPSAFLTGWVDGAVQAYEDAEADAMRKKK